MVRLLLDTCALSELQKPQPNQNVINSIRGYGSRANRRLIDRTCQSGGMARGYSRDLREKLLAMVDSGLSVAEVARRTKVSQCSIFRWHHTVVSGQSLEPGHSPGGPRKIGPEVEHLLRAQVAAMPDATLAEHCAAWTEAGQTQVSVTTMGRALARLGLPLKKRP